MVSRTNTTLDLHLLQRLGLLILLGRLLLLSTSLEPHNRPEHDVLAQRGSVWSWARRLAGLDAHLGPLSALGYAGVFFLFDDGAADALGAFHLFAVLVDEDCDDGFAAVFVFGDLGWGDGGGEVGFAVFGPVGAPGGVLYVRCHGCYVCDECGSGAVRSICLENPPAKISGTVALDVAR